MKSSPYDSAVDTHMPLMQHKETQRKAPKGGRGSYGMFCLKNTKKALKQLDK